MTDSFDPTGVPDVPPEALTTSLDAITPMFDTLAAIAAPPAISSTLAELLHQSTDAFTSTLSSLTADMMPPIADMLASSASALATEVLRPDTAIIASVNSSLAEVLRPPADLFTSMGNIPMIEPPALYHITPELIRSRLGIDHPLQSRAEQNFRALEVTIREFEARLDDDHELGVMLDPPGQYSTIHIESISYTAPDLIIFYGTDDDMQPAQLVQHVSQLSVRLLALKKQRPRARRMGFTPNEDNS